MTAAAALIASMAIDTPATGTRVRFRILPEATGTIACIINGKGGKTAVILDGTGQTVYVTPDQIERIPA